MSKKPLKVIIPDEALKDIAPEDREQVKAELEAMFKDFDPRTDPLPGNMKQVEVLPPGPDVCPTCQVALQKVRTFTVPAYKDNPKVTTDLFECPSCDTPYERVAAN